MKVILEIDGADASTLVKLLLRETAMLQEFLEDAEFNVERQEGLLAEKAEIIKMLSKGSQPRNKVTPTKKRKVGRPKGSKTKRKGVK